MSGKTAKETHTAGPWGVVRRTDTIFTVAAMDGADVSDDGIIAHVWHGHEANARLIAAAPELLEAARAAMRYDAAIHRRADDGTVEMDPLGAVAEGEDLDALYYDWSSKARAAIAKATGEAA